MLTVQDLVAGATPPDGETRAVLSAYLAGDRSDHVAERLRASFRAHAARPESREEMLLGWALVAALADLSGDARRLGAALRWAEADLAQKTETWDPAVAGAGRC